MRFLIASDQENVSAISYHDIICPSQFLLCLSVQWHFPHMPCHSAFLPINHSQPSNNSSCFSCMPLLLSFPPPWMSPPLLHLARAQAGVNTWRLGVHCFIFCASQSCIWVSGRTLDILPYNYLSPLDCVVLSARDSFLFILLLLSMYLVIFCWINQWMGRQ